MNAKFKGVTDKLKALRQNVASNIGIGYVTIKLGELERRVDRLAWDYSDIGDYYLVVTNPDVSSDEEPITIQLPGDMAALVLESLAKPASDRSKRQNAALVVLADLAGRRFSQEYSDQFVFAPSHVSIRPTDPDD